ncbi:MAG: ATP-dependent RNA helicase HrpA [Betaproteobacteria bacterium]|nr:ATP-dependent RNA helicase HrpA [Betaproteobacteria bacterium]
MRHGRSDLDFDRALDDGRGQQQIPRPHQGAEDHVPWGGGSTRARGQGRPRQEGQKTRRLAARAERIARLPRPRFDAALPVSARRAEIRAAIEAHPVVIVCGETGSGKTTQLPKILLEMQRGVDGWIGHTQPRRIAARSVAARIASELGAELGSAVGYKVRFADKVRRESFIKLMTDGILLAETQGDPELRAYDALTLDEAHERSLNIDFLLGYLKRLLPRRPELKLVVTSATIDAEKFSRHFGGAPVIEVSGRLYPVEVRYRPVGGEEEDTTREEEGQALADAVDECCREGPGDVLVFLPGEREIRDAAEVLRKRHAPHTEILPLYSRLSATDQDQVFKPGGARRIVLATNVAETSLTVPGIRYVVDTGVARVKRYSYRNKVEQLRIERISRASASQRAGRCGRVQDGVCVRLYSEAEYGARAPFTDPEVLRSSLAAVILRAKSLHLGDVADFPFVDAPPPRAIADGYALLRELGAVDEANELTPLGTELARLPLDPRVGRMILAARDEHCLEQGLVIAAGLSVQDPRERPLERQAAADLAHAKFDDPRSDFVTYLRMWKHFGELLEHKKSNRKLAEACRDSHLSVGRMREWRAVHAQLHAAVAEMGWKMSRADVATQEGYRAVHRALLAGLLGNVGLKTDESGAYTGARGIKFRVHPSTGTKKPGRWIVAAELAETTRLYARCAAVIEPQWLEELGAHLLKRSREDPHWEKLRAQVVAMERGTLYGLPVYVGRRVNYGPHDPLLARELFIRSALVEGEYETRAPFFQHNRRLLREIERLEHKSRRPDILVDDELIFAFYDSRVPEGIHNGADFEKWRKDAERSDPKLLYLRREDLMRHQAAGITTGNFPPVLRVGLSEFALEYHFEPGSPRDGVTMTVPVALLNQVSAARCEWLVPGLLKEKVQTLAKSMPQRLRHKLGPLAEFAEDFASAVPPSDSPLAAVLARYIRSEFNLEVPLDAFRPDSAPPHLTMKFRVIDEHGRQLALGRNITEIRDALRAATGAAIAADVPLRTGVERHTSWEAGDLAEVMEISRGGQTMIGYPALVDDGEGVVLQVLDSAETAREMHRAGVRRLLAIAFRERLRDIERAVAKENAAKMLFAPIGGETTLEKEIVAAALERSFLGASLPMSQRQFAERCEEGRNRLTLIAQELQRLAGTILAEHAGAQKKLAALANGFPGAADDVKQQCARLLHPHFVSRTPWERLQHFPRYLKAVSLRLDKLRADPARDARLAAELAPLHAGWLREDAARQRLGRATPEIEQFGWLLEELRVALFAQELRTPVPVSAKRLAKLWQSIRNG